MSEESKQRGVSVKINTRGLIAAVLNFIIVGAGYAYLKLYKKAIMMFVLYVLILLFTFYLATFVPILIWVGIPLALWFARDAYILGSGGTLPATKHPDAAPVKVQIKKAGKYCRHCGNKMPSDSSFCESCGKQI